MWWVGAALAAAPEVGLKDLMIGVGAELGRTIVILNGRAEGARCRFEVHGTVSAMGRYEGAVQAAATAGVEARMTPTEIRLDRASVPVRPDVETHVFPFDGDTARLDAVWQAAGAEAMVSTATGTLIVTVDPAKAVGVVQAALPPRGAAAGPPRH
jgi:hypothetical protein